MRVSLFALLATVLLACCFAEFAETEMTAEVGGHLPESPLFEAARTGNVGAISAEIKAGRDINIQNTDGWTPLHFAVEAYQPHAIVLLIRKGANVNIQDRDGWSPLMFAAHAGNTMVVGLLLDAKADTLLVNKNNMRAHSIAIVMGFPAVATYIATEAVKVAMMADDFDTMLGMINDGASVNTRNAAGWTPLIASISAGAEGAVLALLNTPDIDLDLAENDGWTPLMFAANNNRLQMAQWLLERGVDVSVKSRMGFSAVGIARDRNFKEMMALLNKHTAALLRRLAEEQEQQLQRPKQEQEKKDTRAQNAQKVVPELKVQMEVEVGAEPLLQQSAADYSKTTTKTTTKPGAVVQNMKVGEPVRAAPKKKKAGWLW